MMERRLRIGIDGYNLAMAHGTGVATYARTLARTITDLGYQLDLLYGLTVSRKAAPELRETLFFARLGEEEASQPPPPPSLKRALRRAFTLPTARDMLEVPTTGRVIATGFADRLPAHDRLFTLGSLFSISARYFRRYNRFMTVRVPNPPDIMHWTYPVPVRLAGARNIYTLHDLVPLRLPYLSLEDKQYYERLIRHCLREAAHIVTVSETSRTDLLSLFKLPEAAVSNTYQPVDLLRPTEADSELGVRLSRLFDLERDGYFLYFGAIEPKKNVGRLIEAYLAADLKTPFIIVGSRGWRTDQELRLLSGAHGGRLSAADRVRQVEHLPRRLLADLVAGARAVTFPSLYEGFGLPALESLALGRPLLTSSQGALAEIVGEAAVRVDPYDVDAITAALRRLDSDQALRSELSRKGPLQAAQFSADRYRRSIQQLYCAVLGGTARFDEVRPPSRP
jgi:glycosyltransferase involved in cell wall biosynthesis